MDPPFVLGWKPSPSRRRAAVPPPLAGEARLGSPSGGAVTSARTNVIKLENKEREAKDENSEGLKRRA